MKSLLTLLLLAASYASAQTLTPTVTWGPISAITAGAALTPTQLNATAPVSGTFTYTPAAGTILAPGVDVISIVFTPSDTVDFTTATATNTILVVTPSTTPVYSFNLPAIDSLDWGALISANFVALDNILSGVTPLSGTLNVPTASALLTAPTKCSAGQAFPGIDVHGNSVGCFTPSGSVGGGLSSFTVGNLSPLFTATLGGSPLTNPALAFALSNAAANSVFGNFTGSSAAPTFSASPIFSAALLTNFPTFNQSTTGNAATASSVPYSGLTGTVPTWNQNTTGTAANITGVLNASSEPAFTGDVTKASGSVATTVAKINGVALSGLATGILKNTTTTGVPSIAVAGTDYLLPTGSSAGLSQATTGAFGVVKPDGTSITISGGVISSASGGVSTVTTITDLPPIFTVTNRTTTPTFALITVAAHGFLGNNTDFSATPIYVRPTFTDLSGSLAANQLPTFTGDVTTTSGTAATTVVKINGTSLAGLATGLLKNTTSTGVPSIAVAGTDYVIPTGNTATVSALAATPTLCSTGTAPTGILANGNATGCASISSGGITALTGDATASGSGSVAVSVVKINGTSLAGLATGLLKNTTSTGVPSIAISGTDYLLPTGSSAGLSVGSASAFGVLKVDGTTITASSGVISAATGIANTTVTIGTTAIAANTCTTVSTVTMTGLTITSTLNFTPSFDVANNTGWGGTGGLVIDAWPSAANTMSYKTCNQTSASITPGASVTFNVSARS